MTEEEIREVVLYRYAKAEKTIDEVSLLMDSQLWNTSVNRLCYACFYAVSALLATENEFPKTHEGNIKKFGYHFVRTGLVSTEDNRFFNKLLDLRQDADYEDFIEYSSEEVMPLLEPAKLFIERVGILINRRIK